MSYRAERALIGALVIDGEAIARVKDVVLPEDFQAPAMASIYRCMLDLHAHGQAVDYVTICDEIEWSGLLDKDGATPTARALILTETINDAPTSLHVDTYARSVAEARQARRPLPKLQRGDVL